MDPQVIQLGEQIGDLRQDVGEVKGKVELITSAVHRIETKLDGDIGSMKDDITAIKTEQRVKLRFSTTIIALCSGFIGAVSKPVIDFIAAFGHPH